jgi:hypothetical protein
MNYYDLQMELSRCLYGNGERNTRMDYLGQILIICGSISPNHPKMAGLGTTSTIPLEINY